MSHAGNFNLDLSLQGTFILLSVVTLGQKSLCLLSWMICVLQTQSLGELAEFFPSTASPISFFSPWMVDTLELGEACRAGSYHY